MESVDTPIFLEVGEGNGHGAQSLCSGNMETESQRPFRAGGSVCSLARWKGEAQIFLVRKLRKEKRDLAEKVTDYDADEKAIMNFTSFRHRGEKQFCVTYL